MNNNNRLPIILLAFPFIIICVWALYFLTFVSQAEQVVLPIRGYDPRNILSGHYIQYEINWDLADCNQANWEGVCPKKAFKGINKFYVDETKAYDIERKINQAERNLVVFQYSSDTTKPIFSDSVEIVFAYKPGRRPVAVDLIYQGKSLVKQ